MITTPIHFIWVSLKSSQAFRQEQGRWAVTRNESVSKGSQWGQAWFSLICFACGLSLWPPTALLMPAMHNSHPQRSCSFWSAHSCAHTTARLFPFQRDGSIQLAFYWGTSTRGIFWNKRIFGKKEMGYRIVLGGGGLMGYWIFRT